MGTTKTMGTAKTPRTADGEEFRFRAGRSSLDFCSTLLWRSIGAIELLRHPDDLGRWFISAGLWTERHPVSQSDLQTALALREALYQLFLARIRGTELPDATVVNRCAARPSMAPQLSPAGQLLRLSRHPVPDVLSALARDGIDVLTGPSADRLRECAAPDCSFLFVDTSPPGARRWCAHNRCGNRQYAREHRARQDRAMSR